MRTTLFATVALAALIAAVSVARADDFGDQSAAVAYLNQQATNAQLSDPTAPNSIRSHGNH
jgi:hypothetical protein